MPDEESLSREVEEADKAIINGMDGATLLALGTAGVRRLRANVNALVAAVRKQERAQARSFICGPEEMKQQEEPVCAVCGHPEFAQDESAVHISEREQDGGDDSDDFCVMCANEKRQIEYHPFEPAPPPSEEAEALPTDVIIRAWREDVCDNDADRESFDRLVAAIRLPIEEERDRLRALYDEACAAMDVLALHSADLAPYGE